MNKLYFATTNKGKISEARTLLGVRVEGSGLEIDEIQSLDPGEVARKKAEAYYSKLKKPIFVEDVSLSFEALKGLPGTYINDFLKTLGNDGLCELLRGKKNKKATARVTLVLVDGKGEFHEFVGEVRGKIANKPKGDKGFGWDPIFIPDGERKTFGEMEIEEKNKYSMRAKAFKKLKLHLKNLEMISLA